MYHTTCTSSMFTDGVRNFLRVAETNRLNSGSGLICCPCSICKNFQRFNDIKDIHTISFDYTWFYA
ncbi:putative Transposase-associated domain-containing protein [Helianthus annuus]|uniref:Transposase-associated domain-containing protein n=1 Tax=Helianthus annuus TaxID=4232 RepID=A0A9K3IUR0_HELAN|nr:putative Transposase-associated domain-containing protein [Helianthus annuus]